jgi:hypothetical protein
MTEELLSCGSGTQSPSSYHAKKVHFVLLLGTANLQIPDWGSIFMSIKIRGGVMSWCHGPRVGTVL